MTLTMLLTRWLYLLVDEECSLNGVFQPATSFESLKFLFLISSIDHRGSEDPLYGLCHELRQVERRNSLEEILIKTATTFGLQQDFLADLNDVLNLPGYSKLRRLRVQILLLDGMVAEYDREKFRRDLNDAAQAQCSQLYNRPSLDFSCLVAVQGVYDDDLFYYFHGRSMLVNGR